MPIAKLESLCPQCHTTITVGERIVYNHHANFKTWEHAKCPEIIDLTNDTITVEEWALDHPSLCIRIGDWELEVKTHKVKET